MTDTPPVAFTYGIGVVTGYVLAGGGVWTALLTGTIGAIAYAVLSVAGERLNEVVHG